MKGFHFGTKAETLERLRPVLQSASVLGLHYFTVERWRSEPDAVLAAVAEHFGSQTLVVRSSAIGEDSEHDSQAGAFTSLLNVAATAAALREAIDTVVASYHGNPKDQVLVQPMLEDVVMSGVAMTSNLEDGAPYYTISYDESGSTESVTAGTHISKTVHVHREGGRPHVRSSRIRDLISLFEELDRICRGVPLDIEFATTGNGDVILLQVRRISVWRNWSASVSEDINQRLPHVENYFTARARPRGSVVGESTVLGVMPDWNPAEMIGTVPSPLSTSLYRELITKDVWRLSRQSMSYRHPAGEDLMVVLGARPYIDVRNSLNSFLPAALDDALAGRLVDAWIDRLREHPEYHDKLEFEVASTCMTLDLDEAFAARYPNLLSANEMGAFRDALRGLTNRNLNLADGGTLSHAETVVRALEARQAQRPLEAPEPSTDVGMLQQAGALLEECRTQGTLHFATLARHAFIAEALLRSAASRGAMSLHRVSDLKRSVRTVTSELGGELAAVAAGTKPVEGFMRVYGHLRPGTYDIKSMRYYDRDDLFDDVVQASSAHDDEVAFAFTAEERSNLETLLREGGIDVTPDGLVEYARRAIAGREWAKFVFSRNLSDALELLAAWGVGQHLNRESISHIALEDLLALVHDPPLSPLRSHLLRLSQEGRQRVATGRALKLSFLVRDVSDLYVVPVHRTTPTFVGQGIVRGPVVVLDSEGFKRHDLFGKIVCIESADPGFDFIFNRGISALITKYGGSNSHMAIRCNELRVPGAIGCGEQTFRRIIRSAGAELDCEHHTLRPLHEG